HETSAMFPELPRSHAHNSAKGALKRAEIFEPAAIGRFRDADVDRAKAFERVLDCAEIAPEAECNACCAAKILGEVRRLHCCNSGCLLQRQANGQVSQQVQGNAIEYRIV